MAEQALTYALTTVARVKSLLTITVTDHDTRLLYLVNGATDWIEKACGGRRFKEATYTEEKYSVDYDNQNALILKNAPVSSVSAFKYRAGLKSSPSLTDFPTDSWELDEDGGTGIIRTQQALPKGTNTIAVTYVAGYKINFTNYGDMSTHTLPADLTALCERLVIRWFKRREAEGKLSEGFNGSNINWNNGLTDEDKETIARYSRQTQFV